MILLFSDLLLDHNYGIGEESDQLNHLLILKLHNDKRTC